MRIGALWGLGHGVSATLLGFIAFLLKNRISTSFNFVKRLSGFADSAVGFSLLLIGIIGIKESLESKAGAEISSEEGGNITRKSGAAIFANGLLHGFSWDGAPSLAPALAMTSINSCLSFFFSYCLGTTTVMSILGATVGEGSIRLGKAVNSPDLTTKLSFASSVIALFIGLFWIFQSFR